MGASYKQEFEPLLHLGFHPMDLSQIKNLCVESEYFKLSQRRRTIMDNLSMIVERLNSASIVGEAWIDGSFLTKKIDPCDADFVLHIDAALYDEGTPEQRAVVDWIISNLKDKHWCDTYPLLIYKESHPLYNDYIWYRAFYHGRFGWSEGLDPKGIVVLSLPGGTNEPT